MGWTGGQYSLYRMALAIVVGGELLAAASTITGGVTGGQRVLLGAISDRPLAVALLVAAILLATGLVVGLAAGSRDRLAARLLAPLVLFAELAGRAPNAMPDVFDAALEAVSGQTALLPALLLILHARVPAAPFGSLEARERTDPRGGWERPAVQTEIGWGLLCVTLAALFLGQITGPSTGGLAAQGLRGLAAAAAGFALVAALVGSTVQRARATAWIVLSLFGLAWLAAAGTASSGGRLGQALLLIFACEPAWWSGRRLAAARADRPASAESLLPARLFYDGDCGFCHRSVRFILSEELATPAALRLRFAPLGSDTFHACLARHPELEAASLPDSIVLELEDGLVLTRAAAALEIASRLGGVWRLLALAGRLVPTALLDAGYDGIARVRKRLFAQPKDACPILPPDLRVRFDP